MSVSAKVIIAGQNNISSAVKGARNDLSTLAQASQKVGDTLKKAFTVTAIVASLKKLGSVCVDCFNDFSTATRSYKQLSLALKDNSGYKSVVANIDKLSKMTLESKDQVESMVSELAALGKSSDEINRISDAAVALSNVTGKDLTSSMTTLLNTLKGTTTQLNKLGIDTSSLTSEQLKNGAAVDLVIDKFYSLSEAMAEADSSQHIQNIKNTFGDIKQQIGGIIDYNFGPFLAKFDEGLQNAFSSITERINYIGAVIANLPEVASRTCRLIWDIIRRTFEWDTIKDLFLTSINNIVNTIQFLLENLSTTIADIVDGITSGIIYEIQYIGQCLYQELLDALYRVFNTTEQEFKNSWVGKLLDFGNTVSAGLKAAMAVVTMSPRDIVNGGKPSGVSQALMKSAVSDLSRTSLLSTDGDTIIQALKNGADKAFEDAAYAFKDLLSNAWETGKENTKEVKDFLSVNYSDIIDNFKADIDSLIAPALEEISVSADATAHSVENTASKVDLAADEISSSIETASKTFLVKIGDSLGKWASGITGASDSQGSAFGSAVMDSLESNLGEAGELIGNLAVNMAAMGPLLGAIATAIEYVLEGFGETFSSVLGEFIQYGLEPLRELGRVIGQLLLPVLQTAMPFISEISDFLINLFDTIAIVLKPVISLLTGALTPVLTVICAVLDALSPVIIVFAKVLVTVTGTIQYAVQILQHWIAVIFNSLSEISILGWKPFEGLTTADPGLPGNYGTYIQDKWSQIDNAFESTGTTADSAGTSTGTSVSSAGYQGATSITINIYQQAPVVGDNGMREFARMIKSEFDQLSYYGVTV